MWRFFFYFCLGLLVSVTGCGKDSSKTSGNPSTGPSASTVQSRIVSQKTPSSNPLAPTKTAMVRAASGDQPNLPVASLSERIPPSTALNLDSSSAALPKTVFSANDGISFPSFNGGATTPSPYSNEPPAGLTPPAGRVEDKKSPAPAFAANAPSVPSFGFKASSGAGPVTPGALPILSSPPENSNSGSLPLNVPSSVALGSSSTGSKSPLIFPGRPGTPSIPSSPSSPSASSSSPSSSRSLSAQDSFSGSGGAGSSSSDTNKDSSSSTRGRSTARSAGVKGGGDSSGGAPPPAPPSRVASASGLIAPSSDTGQQTGAVDWNTDLASASGIISPPSDTGHQTGAVDKDDGSHLKNEVIARLCYGGPDYKQCLSADPKASAAAFPLTMELHFLLKRFLPPPTCSENDPKCYPWEWRPLYFVGQKPLVRVIVNSSPTTSGDYLYKDFFLDGVMRDGHNFDLKDLPLKPGDKVELYYYDIGQAPSYPPGSNDKEWSSLSLKSYQDFVNNEYAFFMGAFTYPLQKIDREFNLGFSPLK